MGASPGKACGMAVVAANLSPCLARGGGGPPTPVREALLWGAAAGGPGHGGGARGGNSAGVGDLIRALMGLGRASSYTHLLPFIIHAAGYSLARSAA
jgi:hypothetical protein